MEDKKTFGDFITQKRKEIGLTQKSFAEKLYVTESAVSKWERGISYPDITLIRDICSVLQIKEHELLTSSEDLELRKTEKLAKRYTNMIKTYKYLLLSLYGLSLVICFLCNLAVQHSLSWFFIVLASELIAFSITVLPVMVEEQRGMITLGAFFTSIILLLLTCSIFTKGDWFFVAFTSLLFGFTIVFLPYVLHNIGLPEYFSDKKVLLYFSVNSILLLLLLLVCDRYTDGGWFFKDALPIAMFCLTVPWSMMLLIRYCHVNIWFKAAGCVAIFTVFNYYVNQFIDMILGINQKQVDSYWNERYVNNIISLTLFGIAVLFAIVGVIQVLNKNEVDTRSNSMK